MYLLFVTTTSSFIPRSNLQCYNSNQLLINPRRNPTTKYATKPIMNPNSIRCCVEPPAWKRGPVDIDFAKDEQLQILEEELDDAVQAENFSYASTLRDKLLRLQSGSYVAVLSAHIRFYRAFSNGSIVDMAACWLQDSNVTCKHPVGPLSVGYLNVLNSFGYLFSVGVPSIDPSDVKITMRGTIAYVTCRENSMEWQEGESETAQNVPMDAINIYMKRNGEWYICHHSALPILGNKI